MQIRPSAPPTIAEPLRAKLRQQQAWWETAAMRSRTLAEQLRELGERSAHARTRAATVRDDRGFQIADLAGWKVELERLDAEAAAVAEDVIVVAAELEAVQAFRDSVGRTAAAVGRALGADTSGSVDYIFTQLLDRATPGRGTPRFEPEVTDTARALSEVAAMRASA